MTLASLQHPEEIQLFGEWMREQKIRSMIEIGGGPGGTSLFFLSVIDGTLVSIDLPNGSTTGLSKAGCEARNAQLVEISNGRFVGFLGDSHAPVTLQAVKEFLQGTKVDLLFIDGDHSMDGVTRDYNDYKPFVKPGGWVAFHDINADKFVEVDVPMFWRALQGTKIEWTINAEWGGIGAVQV